MIAGERYCTRCGHPEGCVRHGRAIPKRGEELQRDKCEGCFGCKNPNMYHLMRQMETRSKVTG
ncbi:hypothetical protein LCGC14_0381640 [marine sediment metagenome]|uniref:Uncharacterized protein n=1 Tax=marine sediment metagenome TaxID=412755 RepID=A0A0F9TKC9_9ZZZZ